MKFELRKSLARAYLVFASIFLVGLTAGLVQLLIHGQWDWRAIAASPITGFHMALQAIMKGGFLLFPLALVFFVVRASWRSKHGNPRAPCDDRPIEL
jgi:K+ transporter